MLGFIQTLINLLASFNTFVYDSVTKIMTYLGYIFGFAFSVWKLTFNMIPVPLQVVGAIVGAVMLVRLIISLGRR